MAGTWSALLKTRMWRRTSKCWSGPILYAKHGQFHHRDLLADDPHRVGVYRDRCFVALDASAQRTSDCGTLSRRNADCAVLLALGALFAVWRLVGFVSRALEEAFYGPVQLWPRWFEETVAVSIFAGALVFWLVLRWFKKNDGKFFALLLDA